MKVLIGKWGVFGNQRNESKQLTHPFDSFRAVDDDRVEDGRCNIDRWTSVNYETQVADFTTVEGLGRWTCRGRSWIAPGHAWTKAKAHGRKEDPSYEANCGERQVARHEVIWWAGARFCYHRTFGRIGHFSCRRQAEFKEMDEQELMKKSKYLRPAIWAKQHNQSLQDFFWWIVVYYSGGGTWQRLASGAFYLGRTGAQVFVGLDSGEKVRSVAAQQVATYRWSERKWSKLRYLLWGKDWFEGSWRDCVAV